jgi:hypothetical protein
MRIIMRKRYATRWGARTSNPVERRYASLVGSTPTLFRQTLLATRASLAHPRYRKRKGRCPAPPYSEGTLHWRGLALDDAATRFARVP